MIPATARRLIESRSFECLILANPFVDRLGALQVELLARFDLALVDVGRDLSTFLLDQPRAARPGLARDWLFARVSAQDGPALLSGIDLLFEPAFELDPLALFRQAARRNPLIVLWPGELEQGVLAYAVPEHHHYRAWTAPVGMAFAVQ